MLDHYLRSVGERSASDLRSRAARRRAHTESLERRQLLSVSIINGGGLGYVGNGGGGPPDVTGAAGPNSYLEINNSTVTLFSPKPGGAILAQDGINDFFYNPAIGNETRIDLPFSGGLVPITATGATESGGTVTITTSAPHNFAVNQTVQVSGVGVAGYNGTFTITGVTATTFTYTDVPGLANSGGGTATVDPGSCAVCDSTGVFDNLLGTDGRFIVGNIDIDGTTNVSQYIFAVSKSDDPTTFSASDWNFYHVTTTQTSGGATFWTDYPGNAGFNADAFVETFNMAQGGSTNGNAEVISINASDLTNDVPQSSLRSFQNFISGSNNYRAVTMRDAKPGDPMWLVENPNNGTSINVVKMTNVLSNSPTFATTPVTLPGADTFSPSGIGSPLNPDNIAAVDGDDGGVSDVENPNGNPASDPGNRILKASEFNNIIVASHTVAVGTSSVSSATVQVSNGNPVGGSGYTVGDVLTVNGGTSSTAGKLTVATLGPGGSVATVTVSTPGTYSSLSGINGTVTGGSGSGAKFNINFSGQLVAQWYAFDVSGGTPAFQVVGGSPNLGRIGFGANTYAFEPGIDINAAGEIGLGFMESDTLGGAVNPATGGFISTFVTARLATDPAGSMDPVVLVPAGTGSNNINGRIGDFSGMNVDPVNGTFWHTNEFGGPGGPTDVVNFSPEAPPTVTAPADQSAVEGTAQPINLGSFSDPDGSPWTVDVQWGDGTPDTTFNAGSTGTIPAKSHNYAEEGNFTVTVTVTDHTLLSGSATFKVAVSDPAVVAAGAALNEVEGQAFGPVTLATFTDPGGAEPNPGDPSGTLNDHYAITSINWGDGTGLDTTTGSLSFGGTPGSKTDPFTVSASHTYGEEGSYNITVTLDHEGVSTVVAGTATVSDPAVIGSGTSVKAIACLPMVGVPVATFTDPGGAEPNPSDPSGTINNHYQVVSIDWGDATPLDTSSGVLSYGGAPGSKTAPFTVSGTHTYASEGTYSVTVSLNHEGVPTVVHSTVVVRDNIGLLTLDPSGAGALTVSGNGGVVVNNCGAVVVDSSNPAAAILNGNGNVSAMDIDVTGGAVVNGNGAFIGGPLTHEPPMADIVGLPLPAAPSTTFPAVRDTSSVPLMLSPGTYVGGISLSGQARVTLLPGVYYLQGGGLRVSGQASLTGNGVFIINAPGSTYDGISFTGQGNITLTAAASLPGVYSAYTGVTVFQDPAAAAPVMLSGGGDVVMDGILYAPRAALEMTGNGGLTDSTDRIAPVAAVIVYDAILTGNGALTINADAPASNPSVTPLPGAALAGFTSFSTSVNPLVPGQPVIFTATMAAIPASASPPTGLVDFFDETTHLDLGSATLAGGVASVTAPLNSLGSHVITANYLAFSPNYAAPGPDPLARQVQSEAIEGTLLFVGGTGGDVQVQLNKGNVVANTHDGSPQFTTPLAGLSGLVVYAQGGAQIQVDGGLTLPAFLFAGDGNGARIQAGGGATVEVGGAGAGDVLTGSSNRTILIGGAGAARLVAGGAGTILVGGTTDFEHNLATLQSALAIWRSAATYTARVAALGGTFNPGTVHGNGLVDQLRGGGGTTPLDWFFASTLDQITAANPGDIITPIV